MSQKKWISPKIINLNRQQIQSAPGTSAGAECFIANIVINTAGGPCSLGYTFIVGSTGALCYTSIKLNTSATLFTSYNTPANPFCFDTAVTVNTGSPVEGQVLTGGCMPFTNFLNTTIVLSFPCDS